jgi:hypothetical protein
MATQSQLPNASACPEKERLADAFLVALRDLITLLGEEVAEVVRAGSGIPRSDLALRLALKRRDNAKVAYFLHIQEHGC